MSAIKETPVHIREYYKAMRDAYTQKKEDVLKERDRLDKENVELHRAVIKNFNFYFDYEINLSEYPEFINNEYETGALLKVARATYYNKHNEGVIIPELHKLLQLAENQARIHEIGNEIDFCDKILKVKSNDYIRYIREYFTVVHKKMILEGCAYHFGRGLGEVFVNRVKATGKRKALDYKLTKEKKAEILARGGRIYNKEEAEFCQKNGLDYEFEDHRVYLHQEYFYEVVLTRTKFPNYHDFEFTPQKYRCIDYKNMTADDLLKACNYDVNKICELQIDLKAKIALCEKIDKTLYTNFIRNENQTSYKYDPTDRKD